MTLEEQRIKIYEDQRGLFLVHTIENGIINIKLAQHGQGPLGKVTSVDYELGRKFMPRPETVTTRDFQLTVSAYGPMLCIAEVHFTDGSSLTLSRYINLGE